MIQCKIFSGTDSAELEREVNSFLRERAGASVHTIRQSATDNRLVISVFFSVRSKREKLKEAAMNEVSVNMKENELRAN